MYKKQAKFNQKNREASELEKQRTQDKTKPTPDGMEDLEHLAKVNRPAKKGISPFSEELKKEIPDNKEEKPRRKVQPKIPKSEAANIQYIGDKDIYKEFRILYFGNGQNRNQALVESIGLYNEKYKDFEPVVSERELIKTTFKIIMFVYGPFKKLFKKLGQKKDPAITEAILLYIEKYKGEK